METKRLSSWRAGRNKPHRKRQRDTQHHGDETARQAALEPNLAEIDQQDDGERREANNRGRVGPEQERERYEAERDAAERRQQRGSWSGATEALGEWSRQDFDKAGAQTGDKAHAPSRQRGLLISKPARLG